MDVGVIGGSGYGGGELLRLLAGHPAFKVRAVAARATAGMRLAEVFPSLAAVPDLPEQLVAAAPEALAGCELVLLAAPTGAALALAPPLVDAGATVVDLSAAFRLEPAAFERAYGAPHTAPALAPAAYGLPELFRAELPGARLIAGPGCYPTAALLALAPLARLVDPASVTLVGLSGTSGAGRGLREDLHASHASGNAGAYGVPAHPHTSEISAKWAVLAQPETRLPEPPVTFVPHLLPMARGLVVTVTATLTGDAGHVRPAYEAAYAAEPCVQLLDDGEWPQTTHVLGANTAHVAVAVDHDAGRVVASCAIDNLVKGAAGQALQAANVALGLPETAGLPLAGVYP